LTNGPSNSSPPVSSLNDMMTITADSDGDQDDDDDIGEHELD
jgi:hypothetical protein